MRTRSALLVRPRSSSPPWRSALWAARTRPSRRRCRRPRASRPRPRSRAEAETPPPAAEPFPQTGVDKTSVGEADDRRAERPRRSAHGLFRLQQQRSRRRARRRRCRRTPRGSRRTPRTTSRSAGHCDERGSIGYNVALGDRRATAVKDYLDGVRRRGRPARRRLVRRGEARGPGPRRIGVGEEPPRRVHDQAVRSACAVAALPSSWRRRAASCRTSSRRIRRTWPTCSARSTDAVEVAGRAGQAGRGAGVEDRRDDVVKRSEIADMTAQLDQLVRQTTATSDKVDQVNARVDRLSQDVQATRDAARRATPAPPPAGCRRGRGGRPRRSQARRRAPPPHR